MERDTIFIGFLSLLLSLGLDALNGGSTWIIIWLAGIALWGVCQTLTLSQRLEDAKRRNRHLLRQVKGIAESHPASPEV